MCFDTGDLSSIPSFQTFLDHSGTFPTSNSKHVPLVNTISTLNLCQKIGLLLLRLLLLYFKPFFSDYLLYYITKIYPNTTGPESERHPSFLAFTGYKVGTLVDVLSSLFIMVVLFDIVAFPLIPS